MIRCDAVIIGGGFAGSLVALVLGRQGLKPVVVDPHAPYPADVRCETFSPGQVAQLKALGVLDAFHGGVLYEDSLQDLTTRGLRYDALVNALRRQWPGSVRLVAGRVTGLRMTPDRQTANLGDGRTIDARLIVMASGARERLLGDLGVTRTVLAADHAVCIGFTLTGAFGFEGLLHHGERPGDGVGHASLFRLAATPHLMRVNLFLYDSPKSARVRAFRLDPLGQLVKAMPGLRTKLLLSEPVGTVDIRASDLYDTGPDAIDGAVLIGDARRSSCPVSGAGISCVLSDVARLQALLPGWLEIDGMPAARLAAFQDHPSARDEDAVRHRRSLNGRALATETGLGWRLRHLAHKLTAATAPGVVRHLARYGL